jgi:cytochrome c553
MPPLPPPANTKVDFAADIAPIFKTRCQSCHGADTKSGGLRLDDGKAALAGGYSGPVIKPGDSAGSKLIRLVAGLQKGMIMPLVGERLTSEQVGLLRAWIDQGATWPDGGAVAVSTPGAPAKKTHWAFIPPQRPALPSVHDQAWVRNPIDSFVLSKLESEHIAPSAEADRVTLIRRLSLDVVGLAPSPDEVDQFVNDHKPGAYERMVDRLLASPHFGEKWARPWLDLAHYADSDGYEKDNIRPYAWKWRDWVIQALNINMPFDQFSIEQVAGDLVPGATLETKTATGFFRNTLTNREGGVDPEEYRVEQVIDRTNTLGATWLGLTVGCARCHDHKFDPISQKEFYQLTAFFNTVKEANIDDPTPDELGSFLRRRPDYERKRQELLAQYKVADLQADWEQKTLDAAAHPGVSPSYDQGYGILAVIVDDGQQILKTPPAQRNERQRDALTNYFVQFYGESVGRERYKELKFDELWKKLDQLERDYPALSQAQTIVKNPHPPETHLLIRGDYKDPGIEVQPGTLAVLNPLPADPHPSRLTLARWLVSRDNPLTARVIVNRVWQEYFGQGLVDTSADFGTRGDPPTHPELLDWLATEFMQSGWDVKHIHKLIVESATYRQSSNTRPDLENRDPENKLLARQVRLRLPAELIRDETLGVSGLLDVVVGGESVRPPQPPGVLSLGFGGSEDKWRESQGAEKYRRGLYVMFLRTTPYPELVNFDAPDSLQACSRRGRSTTPLQALNLLNDPVFMEAAQVLATRIMREQHGSVEDRLRYGFRLSLGRAPTSEELTRLDRYFAEQKALLAKHPELGKSLFSATDLDGIEPADAAVWVCVSRLLLNLDEFITRS